LQLNVEDLLGSYHKLIMDPVHGGIPLSRFEVAIIDHPLFQRLRFICQNDILSLVFPGATHSRFLHSIGAMHVGGRMFMAMVENGLKKRPIAERGSVEGSTLEAVSYFHRIVRSACLLHDSGHSSFSHQFNRTPAIQEILAAEGLFETLWDGVDTRFIYEHRPAELEHEHYSVRVAHELLKTSNSESGDIETNDILALMETVDIQVSPQFEAHARAIWPLIHGKKPEQAPSDFPVKFAALLSSIVSGELDADRADYMLRDGFHSSVTIGGFNLDHLLSNLHFGLCDQTQWVGMAIAEKGLSSLEDFVYSRHQMYRQVYAHKTAQGFDWLLRSAIDEVMSDPEVHAYVQQSLTKLEYFQALSDSYFWEAFRRYRRTNPKSYSRCILDRLKMSHLATRLNLSKDEQQTYQRFLASESKQPEHAIVRSNMTARFTKIRGDFSGIKVLSKASDGHQTFKLITQTSQFFEKFNDDQITHFYIDPKYTLS
jgi:HD superfamily phosphohydrolase